MRFAPNDAARFPDMWRKKNEDNRLPICYLVITRRNYESRARGEKSRTEETGGREGETNLSSATRRRLEVGKIEFCRRLCFAFAHAIAF